MSYCRFQQLRADADCLQAKIADGRTENPGSALLAIVTLDTWPTIVGQPCADPTAIAAGLG